MTRDILHKDADIPVSVSVIVVSTAGEPCLSRTLEALERQRDRIAAIPIHPQDIEFVIVHPPSRAITAKAAASAKRLGALWTLAHLPNNACPAAALRAKGLQHSRGRLCLFLEDNCPPNPDWLRHYLTARRTALSLNSHPWAATGPILPDVSADLVSWSVFFCEYTDFLPTFGATPRPTRFAGPNFAADRALAQQAVTGEELHEWSVRAIAQASGATMQLLPLATVTAIQKISLKTALKDRITGGRAYGRLQHRFGRWSPLIGWGLGPVILVAQALRIAKEIQKRRRFPADHQGVGDVWETSVFAAPIVLALLSAWTLGEVWGWTHPHPQTHAKHPQSQSIA